MTGDLRRQTLSALAWSFAGQFLKQGASFVIGVILARLLVPEHFGLIAMVLAFTRFASIFMNLGLSLAIIQQRETTQADLSTIFWTNMAIAATLTSLFFLGAPWLARFYEQPLLEPMTRALSFSFLIEGSAIVQRALFAKKVDFKTYTLVNAASVTVAGALGVALAIYGYGVWSLVWHQLAVSIVSAALIWMVGPWRPSLTFRRASLKKVMSFSLYLLGDKLLTSFFEQADKMILGKLTTTYTLGLYNRGESLMRFPVRFFSHAMPLVLVSVMSKLQDDLPKLRAAYAKFLNLSCFLLYPGLVMLAAFAADIIRVLLGDKWLEAAPFLQLFCVIGFAEPITTLTRNTLIAVGDTRLLLRLELVKKTLILTGMIVGLQWGVFGLLIARVSLAALYTAPELYFSGKRIAFRFFGPHNRMGRILLANLAAGLAAWALSRTVLSTSLHLDLALKALATALGYALAARVLLPGLLRELRSIIREKIAHVNDSY